MAPQDNIEINTDDLDSKCESGLHILRGLYRVLSDRNDENYSWNPIDPNVIHEQIRNFEDLTGKLRDSSVSGEDKLEEFNALIRSLSRLLDDLQSPQTGRIHEGTDSLEEMKHFASQLAEWFQEIQPFLKEENKRQPLYAAEDFVSQIRRRISNLESF